MRNRFQRLIQTAAVFVLSANLAAQVLPRAAPDEVGLSSERLARIDAVMQEHVDQKKVAGVVTLIARKGKLAHLGVYGMAGIEANKQMAEDTIFRIASMTKPITSVAVMMLYEEGKFLLSDPVGKYIPEFQEMEVLPPAGATNNYRVPAERPMTIRHLLTHTSGLTYGDAGLRALYEAYEIPSGLGPVDGAILEKMKVLGRLPLAFHPGERYNYGLSVDVLGALVEVWSGMTFAEFLEERVFGPLGMKDTHFYLPEDKAARLAQVYRREEGKPIEPSPERVMPDSDALTTSYPYKGPRTYFSGGAGLSSTAMDYARFCQMMLNGGELDGVRLLSPATVKLMTMDHARKIAGYGAPSFGLGFFVDSAKSGFTELTSEGTHGWGGFWYTQFFISPEKEMIGVFMAQLQPTGGLRLDAKFKGLAHQAIVE